MSNDPALTARRIVEVLAKDLYWTLADRLFWVTVAEELGPLGVKELAKAVAFMKKVEGF